MKKIITLLAATLLITACGPKKEVTIPDRPKTEEEFKAVFKEAYDSGKTDQIFDLIDLSNSGSDFKEILKGITTSYAGIHKVQTIEFIPYEPDPMMPMEMNGKKIEATIEPTYWFICDTAATDKEETGQIKTAVGRDSKGSLAFCGMRYQ